MNKPLSGALLCVLLAVMPAEAQTYHDNPTVVSGVVPIPANIGGVANGVAVSSTSSATSLPASGSIYPAININNAGSVTAYVQLGASTTTSAGAAIPAGGNACLSAGLATQLAAITATSTTTLNITQANACIQGAGGGGGGGGGGGTTQSDTYGFNGTAWSQIYVGTGAADANSLAIALGGNSTTNFSLGTTCPSATGAQGYNSCIAYLLTQPGKLVDGGGANVATVKAASTSAALTDTSLVVAQSPNPAPQCTGIINIFQTVSTDVHTFTNFGYICAIKLVSATAQNIGVDEGTGTTCETSGTAIDGVSSTSGATPTNAVAANGGWSMVAATPWLKLAASGDHLCILQSGV